MQEYQSQIQGQTEELSAGSDNLERVNQIQLDFLSNVSHELRTPLTSIKSLCEILLMFGDDDAETRQEFLQNINEECDRLLRLINNILDFSKLESGKMEWHAESVDMGEVISTATNVMLGMAQAKGLALESEVPEDLPSLNADRDKLVQVVTNLIGNAIKFTDEGEISIGFECSNGELLTYVSDTGIGIADENHELVFEKFKQVGDILTDKPSGTGLGLSICREIINHHEGRIWVESELGKGSTFYFTLPLNSQDDEELVDTIGNSNASFADDFLATAV